MLRRPVPSLKSVMSNLHLLTGVPSFARWPLNLHFLAKDAQKAWDDWIETGPSAPGSKTLKRLAEFDGTGPEGAAGIHALVLDYSSMKDYAEKAHNVVLFGREGRCVVCHEVLDAGEGLYPMCPNDGCEAMGHLKCWSQHALSGDPEQVQIIPDVCECPSCGGDVRWGDMMKELSLRSRGADEVEKLLKAKKRRTKTKMT